MIKAKALKSFSSSYNGNVTVGDFIELPESPAIQMAEAGLIQLLRGGKPEDNPFGGSGEARQSQSSPAGQASKKRSVITSESFAKPSQSTQVSEPSADQIASTQSIEHGGESTQKKPRKTRKSGRATRGPQKGTD